MVLAAPVKSGIQIRHGRSNQITNHDLQRDVRNCAVSPDGRWIVVGDHGNGTITLYEAAGVKKIRDLMGEGGMPVFSPDGRWLFATPLSRVGKLWDTTTWTQIAEVQASYLAFSHDGRLAAASDAGNQIRFLETGSWREIARLEMSDYQIVRPLHFSLDGSRVVCLSEDLRLLAILELGGLRAELKRLNLDWDWPELAPGRDEPIPPRVRLVTPAEAESRNKQIAQLSVELNQLILQKKPKAALARLDQFLEDDYGYPPPSFRWRRIDLLAALRRWDEAAEEMEARQAELSGDARIASWIASEFALLQLYQKHNEAYEVQRRWLIEHCRDPMLIHVNVRERVAKAVLLAPPESGGSYARIREMLPETDLDKIQPDRKPWLYATLGLLACRMGEHERADEHFQKALASNINLSASNFYALAHFGQALNEHARGNKAASKQAYLRGQRINFDEMPADDESLDANWWYDWLGCQVLRRELEQALFGKELASRKEQIQGAISLQEEGLTQVREEHGDKHSQTIEALAELASLQQLAGAAEPAVANWKQAYELAAAAKGPSDAFTLHLAVSLGEAYRKANQSEEVLNLLEPLSKQLDDVPEIKHQLGESLLQMNRHQEALPLLQRSYAMPFKLGINPAIDAQRRLACGASLIRAYDADGNHAKVIEVGEPLWKTLSIPRRTKIDSIPILNSIAKAFRASSKFDKAVPYYEELSIAILEKHDPLAIESLMSKHELALAYHQAGQSAKAVPIYEEVLPHLQKREGRESSSTLQCVKNLAEALLAVGDSTQAIKRFEELFYWLKTKHGEDSKEFVDALHNVGLSFYQAKQFDKAIEYYEASLAGIRKLQKEPGRDLWTCLNDLASAYYSKGEHAKAIPLLEEAVRYLRPQPNVESDYGQILTLLARSYRTIGEHQKSLAASQEALDFFRREEGGESVNVYVAMHNLALGFAAAGDYQQAIMLYEQALPKVRELRGRDHEFALIVAKNFAAALRSVERFEKSEALYEEVANQRRAASGLDEYILLNALLDLAEAHAFAGHWDKALKINQEVADRFLPQWPADDWRAHRVNLALGVSHLGLKNVDLAEPLLTSFDALLTQFDKLPKIGQDYMPIACKRIIDLYESQSLPAKANLWRTKLKSLPAVNK
jgi:tetratricopeptide (TPR) repeat protein